MKSKQKNAGDRQKSRRRFTKRLAAALVAAPAVAASAAVSAQTGPAAREPKAPPNPQTTPTPAATTPQQQPPPQKPSPVAEAYAEVARARFGKHMSDEEFARVKRDLEGNVRTAERLAASKLKNSDEPDFIFGA